jgi:hypothetical protein
MWGNWLATWGNLTATAVLVSITAWYAFLTNRLADSAKRSADSAKEAAEASKASMAASVAGVAVGFTLSPEYGSWDARDPNTKERIRYINVVATGATLFVHPFELFDISWPIRPGESIMHVHIADLPPDESVPARLHNGEYLSFKVPKGMDIRPGSVEGLEGTVRYSLDGSSEPIDRHVKWRGVPETDFNYAADDPT